MAPAPMSEGHSYQVGQGGGGAFLQLLAELSQEYFAVVGERDKLRAAAAAPPKPTTPKGHLSLALMDRNNAFGMKSPDASSNVSRECSLGGDSSDGDGPPVQPCKTIVNIETPQVLLRRRGMRTQTPDPECSRSKRRLRTTQMSSSLELGLDSLWRDLYCANEFEAEVEDAATRTFRNTFRAAPAPNGEDDVGRRSSHHLRASQGRSFWSRVPLTPCSQLVNFWNLLGGILILFDAVVIPLSIAYNFAMPSGELIFACCWWSLDILLMFNVGFYGRDGSAVMSRRCVARRYARTLLVGDVLLLMINYVDVSSTSWTVYVRGFTLLRLLKLGRAKQVLEDKMADWGAKKLIMVWSVTETLGAIFLITHFLACAWYGMGARSHADGRRGWMDSLGNPVPTDAAELYSRSLCWVLGNLLAAPVDPNISPQNTEERNFTICVVAGSLLVVGLGISKMTDALAELNRASAEGRDTTRQLRQVLRTTGVDSTVVSRMVRFAMHSWRRQRDITADTRVMELLSKNMATELIVYQRSVSLNEHPFLAVIKDNHPEVFATLCSAFAAQIYADHELIFSMDTLSERLYCTVAGRFVHRRTLRTDMARYAFNQADPATPSWISVGRASLFLDEAYHGSLYSNGEIPFIDEDCVVDTFRRQRFICETSLFYQGLHQSELRTVTFADALTLTGSDFANCVRSSPKCVGLVYRYAKKFLELVSEAPMIHAEFVPLSEVRHICDGLPKSVASEVADLDSPAPDKEEVLGFVESLADVSTEIWVLEKLPKVFGELHPSEGVYAKLGHESERNRVLASICSFAWLLRGDYARFSEAQPKDRRLTQDLWAEFQHFVRWVDLNEEEIHAMLVFLVIRGLGKVTSFQKAMPNEDRFPESVTRRVLRCMDTQVPCKTLITSEQIDLLDSCICMHKAFSLAQLLQGENTPHQITELQALTREHGDRVFKFSLFAHVAMLCGIRGAEVSGSSLFMDRSMSRSVLMALSVLRDVAEAAPVAMYWSFIRSRAETLGLAIEDEEDLTLARLSCLIRATPESVEELTSAWRSLSWHERRALTKHFLADGDSEPAFVFTFLPLYLTNAKSNMVVGLRRALVVLIDIIDRLEIGGYAEKMGLPTVAVNLEDFGPFAKDVKSPSAFMAVSEHFTIIERGSELMLTISTKHKQSVGEAHWSDAPDRDAHATLRRMGRAVVAVADAAEDYRARAGHHAGFVAASRSRPKKLVSM